MIWNLGLVKFLYFSGYAIWARWFTTVEDEIILGISSSLNWLKMMDSWKLGGTKSEKDLLENFTLDCTYWTTVELMLVSHYYFYVS